MIYFGQGLKNIGELKAGETLVVSGAAGAVGAIACQLGKFMGAKVYAIAGTEEKCEWLEKECGVEKAFNYKSPTFLTDFKKTVKYLDVYFDNVGGDILDFMLTRLNKYARIVMCGEQIFPLRDLGGNLIWIIYLQALFPPIVRFSL